MCHAAKSLIVFGELDALRKDERERKSYGGQDEARCNVSML